VVDGPGAGGAAAVVAGGRVGGRVGGVDGLGGGVVSPV
jgi:hypothetical protein